MLDAEIRFEVERARLRGWRHAGRDAGQAPDGLELIGGEAIMTTVVVSEPDRRTGFLTLADLGQGPRRILWTEIGQWSADEVAHRTRDHQRRYYSSRVVAIAPSDSGC